MQFLILVLIVHVGTPRCFTVVVDAALLMWAFYIYSPDNVKLWLMHPYLWQPQPNGKQSYFSLFKESLFQSGLNKTQVGGYDSTQMENPFTNVTLIPYEENTIGKTCHYRNPIKGLMFHAAPPHLMLSLFDRNTIIIFFKNQVCYIDHFRINQCWKRLWKMCLKN